MDTCTTWHRRPAAESCQQQDSDAARIALGRIVTDSRQVQAGDVFWAICRERIMKATCFVDEAFRRGARRVASRVESMPDECWALHVDDTQRALAQWARWKRRKFTGIVIGVTGSVGKTTTRQMIHTVLQSRLQGNRQPAKLQQPLGRAAEHVGHRAAARLRRAGTGCQATPARSPCWPNLSAPKVGVITQLGNAHLGGFGSRQGVAEAKTELLAALPSSGQAVLADDSVAAIACRRGVLRRSHGSALGRNATCARPTSKPRKGRLEFHVICGNRRGAGHRRPRKQEAVRFSIPVWGRHHVPRRAQLRWRSAACWASTSKRSPRPWHSYQAVPMRCEVIEIRGAMIINDTCNSNPTAMRAALELLRDFESAGRRIVICGDMAESGPQSIALHWQMGKEIVQIGGAELVIACGQFARHVTAGARCDGPGACASRPLRYGRGGNALRGPGGDAGRHRAGEGLAADGDGARDRRP